MATVPTYSFFVWVRGDDGLDQSRRGVPRFDLERRLRWYLERGYTSILIEETGTAEFDSPELRRLNAVGWELPGVG